MRRWFRIAVPMGIAVVLVAVLAIGFGSPSSQAAPGGNGHGNGGNATPNLAVTVDLASATAGGQPVSITGSGFPRNTAVFVVITDMPSILVESDGSGSFETATVLSEPGTYWFSACFFKRTGWD